MTLVHRIWRLAVMVGLLAAAAAIAGPALAKGAGVNIVAKTFDPAKIEIQAGDTVTWTVTKAIGEPHSVTAGKPSDTGTRLFDSGVTTLKDDGSTYQFTFNEPGTYDYFCTVHPVDMTGQVVVTAAGGSGGAGGAEAAPEGVAPERKLITAGILIVALIGLFAASWYWRRLNPA